MKLEFLPNEILLELFNYIDDIELLCIFYNLNSRFNNLLFISSKQFYFNFQSILKKDMDFICRRHIPRIKDRIISLRLSNDDDTPYQTNQFFSYQFRLHHFTHLKSLSLYRFYCPNVFNKILLELSQLKHLTYLKIDQVRFYIDDKEQLVNIIWNLPELIYFYISNSRWLLNYSFVPELTISSPIKYLNMMDIQFSISQLTRLFKCTSHLENLSISIYQDLMDEIYIFDNSLINILPSLNVLNINFQGTMEALEYILQNIPNLYYMKIEAPSINMNGHMWQEMICNYLSKLKIFHLQMSFILDINESIEELVDELLDTFQTPFWIDEHQWFVRCNWHPQDFDITRRRYALLYTLPYVFDDFDHCSTFYSKSTCPNKTDYWSLNHVYDLFFYPTFTEQDMSCYPIRFPNIRYLKFSYKLENIGIICPTLDQLNTIDIYNIESQYRSNLQTLLDRAPRLQTIIFAGNSWLYFFVKSKSVRRIIIYDDIYYNARQCADLCTSSLFNQCEVLQINIRTQGSVLDFLRRMPKLRVLTFKCEHDQWNDHQNSLLLKKDDVIKWLKRYLPSDCLIKREENGSIRLWIY